MNTRFAPVRVMGYVESRLVDPMDAPRQPDELSAPNAVLRIEADYVPALACLHEGDEIVVVTWLHLADRDTSTVHPRNDGRRARVGVFATRSRSPKPDRASPHDDHRRSTPDRRDCQLRSRRRHPDPGHQTGPRPSISALRMSRRGLEQTVWRYLCAASFVIYTEAAIEAAAKNHPGEEQT